jgi:hypothetical protein
MITQLENNLKDVRCTVYELCHDELRILIGHFPLGTAGRQLMRCSLILSVRAIKDL